MTSVQRYYILRKIKSYLKLVSVHRRSQWFDKFTVELEQNYGKWVNEVVHWVVAVLKTELMLLVINLSGCQVF